MQKNNKKSKAKKKSYSNNDYKKSHKNIYCNLFGVHASCEAILNPKRHINEIFVTEQGKKTIDASMSKSKALGIKRPEPVIVDKRDIEKIIPPEAVHQGIAIKAQDLYCSDLNKFCEEMINNQISKENIFVVLDQVTDPHNIGAILRSIAVFGGKAMIIQQKHTPEINGTIAKIASGAVEHVPVFREVNISRSLETLKKHDILCVGLDERGKMELSDITADKNLMSYSGIALVMGAEGDGMRRLTAEKCDILARLPSPKAIKSLNVSNAAAVALYELVR